jgi:hypothetical protein
MKPSSYTLPTVDWSFGVPLTTIIQTGLHYSFVPSAPCIFLGGTMQAYLLLCLVFTHPSYFLCEFTHLYFLGTMHPLFFSGFMHPLFILGLCIPPYLSLALRTHYLSFGFMHPLPFAGFMHPLPFAGFTHPLYLFGFTHPLSFVWAYAPIILIWVYTPVIFRLGLRTRYLSLEYTYPLSIIWVLLLLMLWLDCWSTVVDTRSSHVTRCVGQKTFHLILSSQAGCYRAEIYLKIYILVIVVISYLVPI